jgi:hypothetical protein
MGISPIQKRQVVCVGFLRLLFAIAIGFPIGAACAQDKEENVLPPAWVSKPSPRLAAKFRHWRLKFELGKSTGAPEKGVFPSFSPGQQREGTARLVTDLGAPRPIKLTPVRERTRYLPATDQLNPNDKVITKEIVNIFRNPEIAKFVTTKHLDNPQLDLERNLAVVLVQDFEAALRARKKKEHIWSINWRVETKRTTDYVGYEAWGLFSRVNGVLRPFYLAGRNSIGEAPSASYYYILAVGDLDGDGIDELIAREMVFESEQDDLEIWAWERGAPATIHKIP